MTSLVWYVTVLVGLKEESIQHRYSVDAPRAVSCKLDELIHCPQRFAATHKLWERISVFMRRSFLWPLQNNYHVCWTRGEVARLVDLVARDIKFLSEIFESLQRSQITWMMEAGWWYAG